MALEHPFAHRGDGVGVEPAFAALAIGAYLLMLRFVLIVPITIAGFVLLVMRYGGCDVAGYRVYQKAAGGAETQ